MISLSFSLSISLNLNKGIIVKKKGGVNPPYHIQKFFQTIPLDEYDNKTSIDTLYMLKDNKRDLYCPYPYHHSDNGNFPLLTKQ